MPAKATHMAQNIQAQMAHEVNATIAGLAGEASHAVKRSRTLPQSLSARELQHWQRGSGVQGRWAREGLCSREAREHWAGASAQHLFVG